MNDPRIWTRRLVLGDGRLNAQTKSPRGSSKVNGRRLFTDGGLSPKLIILSRQDGNFGLFPSPLGDRRPEFSSNRLKLLGFKTNLAANFRPNLFGRLSAVSVSERSPGQVT